MAPQGKSKPSRPKTKTFVGCWTCRSRKVKCDSARPQCHRCMKAGLVCQGYDIKLYWVHHDDHTPTSSVKRQAMSLLSEKPHWNLSADCIDNYLDQVSRSQINPGSGTTSAGPFSVFFVPTYHHENGQDDTESSQSSGCPVDILSSTDFLNSLEDPPAFDEEFMAMDPPLTITRPSSSLDFLADSLTLSGRSLQTTASRDTLVGRLINHYVTVVANILQPIFHPRNTYTSLYVPSAMTALKKISGNSPYEWAQVPSNEAALFYSLLASSAFHLRGYADAQKDDGLGYYCRSKSLFHLQKAVDSLQSSNPERDFVLSNFEDVMSIMLTLVTADVMNGSMSEFWIHLNAAKKMRKRLRGRVQPNSRGESLINISCFLGIISDSTDCDPELLPWLPEGMGIFDDDDEDIFSGDGHGLESTYGITATLADFIRQICKLSRHLSYYVSINETPPTDLLMACEDLLQKLGSWDIEQESLLSFSQSDELTILLAKKHILAFAQSIRIFYHTRLFPCPPDEMTTFIDEVVANLNEMEAIKRGTGYDAVLTATVTWPGFIASCEADKHHRDAWYEWWNTMLEYHIGNINDLWSIVQEAWRLRDEGINETPTWTPVVRNRKARIIAI